MTYLSSLDKKCEYETDRMCLVVRGFVGAGVCGWFVMAMELRIP